MKKETKLNLCIIGGREFGKTSMAVSLLNVASTTGAITPIGNSSKLLAIKNDFLRTEGKMPATEWKEISKLKYNLVGAKRRTWTIHFHDYPGELFEKCSDKSNFDKTGNKTGREFDKHAEGIAIKLMRHMERSDAVIILAPADINSQKYERDLAVYKSNLSELIECIYKRNPKIPVCLCVNKWDIAPSGTTLDAILQQSPFNVLDGILKNRCPDNYIKMEVSAFGKHKDTNPTFAASGAAPFNLIEMLLKVAEMAECVRNERFIDDAKKATLWQKIFTIPFKSWAFNRLGCSDDASRDELEKISRTAWRRLAGTVGLASMLAVAGWLGIWTIGENRALRGIEESITKTEYQDVTKAQIINWKAHFLKDALLRKLCCQRDFVSGIQQKLGAKEDAYNKRLQDDLTKWLEEDNHKDFSVDPSDATLPFPPEQRIRRANERISQIGSVLENLTNRELSQNLDTKIRNEKELIESIKQNGPIDDAIIQVYNCTKDRRCRGAEVILIAVDNNELRYTKNRVEKLKKDLAIWEQELQAELTQYLHSNKDNPNDTDWKKRIADAQNRIETIESFKPQFSSKTHWAQDHNQKILDEKELIANLNLYGPFEDELIALKTVPINERCVKAAQLSIRVASGELHAREESLTRLNQLLKTCEQELQGELERELALIPDNSNSDWRKRIKDAQKRIDTINTFTPKFSPNTPWSQNHKQEILDDKKLIDDLNLYGPFEDELVALQAAPINERCVKAEQLSRRVVSGELHAREESLTRLNQFLVTWEQELQKDLEHKLALIPDNSNSHWEKRKEDAKGRITAINQFTQWFSGKSGYKQDHKQKTDYEMSLIRKLELYGPFEDELAKLNRRCIRDMDSFLKKFKAGDYPERSVAFDGVKNSMKSLVDDLTKNLDQKLKEATIVDDNKMAASTRVERAQNRIKFLQDTANQLAENSTEFYDITEKIKQEKIWIESHQKYVDFENDWNEIEKVPQEQQISRIADFLKAHSKERYPEYADKINYSENRRKSIIISLKEQLTDELKGIPDTGHWENQVRRANSRVDKINSYHQWLPIDEKTWLDQLVLNEKKAIERITRDGRFNDAFDGVQNSPVEERLEQIKTFYESFKIEDYPERSSDYEKLSALKENTKKELDERLSKAIAIPKPQPIEFAAQARYYREIQRAYESSLQCYPESLPEYSRRKNQINEIKNLVEKYQKWTRLKSKSDAIIQEVNQEIILSLIDGFYREYARDDYPDPEVSDIFNQLNQKQASAESFIYQKLMSELESNISGLGSNDDERRASTRTQISTINSYLPRFIKDSLMYTKFMTQRNSLLENLEREERYQQFNNACAELDKTLSDPSMNAYDKIKKIETFEGMFPEEEYPEGKPRYIDLSNQKKRLAIESDWAQLSEEIDYQCQSFPSDDKIDLLKEFRGTCQSLQTKCKSYKQYSHLASMVNGKIKVLDECIKKINQIIGSGSYNEIYDAEESYKRNPSEMQYLALTKKINGFDTSLPENVVNQKKVNETKDRLEKDRELLKQAQDLFQKFRINPSQDSFAKFSSSVDELDAWVNGSPNTLGSGYNSNHKSLGQQKTFIRAALQLRPFASWKSFNFKGTNFERSFADNQVELYIDDALMCEIRDVQANEWNRLKHSKLVSGSLDFPITLNQGVSLKIKIVNTTSLNTEGTDWESFWEILAAGSYTGEFTKKFNFRGNGSETKDATVEILFSGLPKLEE